MGDLSMTGCSVAQVIVERRWSLEWSRGGIVFGYVARRVPVEASTVTLPRRPRAAVIAGLLGCGAVASAALASVPSADRGSRLVIAVPPAIRMAPPVAPTRVAVATGRKHRQSRLEQPSVNAAIPRDRTEGAAVAAAMADGAMQEWQDQDGTTHYLVAGEVAEEGGLRCRDLSLLTRNAGGHDSVAQSRRCV